ncbi:Probable short-chain dehydrogenase [Heterostelium album PN500]|uniref:Probable short-chain dehydrogenase n=1 Tax=Heterostelium pallidum (strain ATCC 26659 / Pp 5 / PN500) TaxID=670386 RepID=D3AXA0_HETP5|nr:Probable short-chain dehydrogenase [Heterostelium album PN500]EFA86169.1 Probable short-chain dehydrogenase [Heterostelium album PN500]|eukprot:XP_020438274.1 Probable short-chain dehydrogenase [Heterostelium album PN500]
MNYGVYILNGKCFPRNERIKNYNNKSRTILRNHLKSIKNQKDRLRAKIKANDVLSSKISKGLIRPKFKRGETITYLRDKEKRNEKRKFTRILRETQSQRTQRLEVFIPSQEGELNTDRAKFLAKQMRDLLHDEKDLMPFILSSIVGQPLNFIQMVHSYLTYDELEDVRSIWLNDRQLAGASNRTMSGIVTNSILLRKFLGQQKSSAMSAFPNQSLMKLFNSKGTMIFDFDQVVAMDKEESRNIVYHSKPAIVISKMDEFKVNFHSFFTNGVLRKVTWESDDVKVVVAGGSVLAALTGSTEDPELYRCYLACEEAIQCLPHVVKQKIRSYLEEDENTFNYHTTKRYHSKAWAKSDIDLFLVCKDTSLVPARIQQLVKEITSCIPVDYKLLRTEHSITILPLYPYRPIQIVTTLLREISDHVLFSDLDCTSFVYDPTIDNIFTLERGLKSLSNRVNIVPPNAKGIKRAFNKLRYNLQEDEGLPYGRKYNSIGDVELKLNENDGVNSVLKSVDDIPEVLTKFPVGWKCDFQKKCYQCERTMGFQKKQVVVCSACRRENQVKWDQWDSIGNISSVEKHAIVTGARNKIGYQAALRLLRSGYNVLVTTRFPHTALVNYKQESDSQLWIDKLQIYGIDFRHLPSVNKFIQYVLKTIPRLDILINNAAQTIRRPRAYYQTIFKEENRLKSLDNAKEKSDQMIISPMERVDNLALIVPISRYRLDCSDMTQIIVNKDDEEQENHQLFPVDMLDEHGDQLDMRSKTTWNNSIEEITMEEMLEVQLINVTVPFMLMSQFMPLMVKSRTAASSSEVVNNNKEWAYVINVTSQEGSFHKEYQNGYHVHTNMAKASLNMMTLSTSEQYIRKRIFICSVDPGWVTKMTTNAKPNGAEAPLSAQDGAARILDPIYSHIKDYQTKHGILYKHFKPSTCSITLILINKRMQCSLHHHHNLNLYFLFKLFIIICYN